MVPWRDAWHDALYAGGSGFYTAPAGPSAHFTTATHGVFGPVLAGALATLAGRDGLGRVVDIGCGRGELLTALHELAPDLDLVGVDVVDRPDGVPAAVSWVRSPGGAGLPGDEALDAALDGALVVANEWLDVVPCTVAEVAPDGSLREVLVDPATGHEALGGPLSDADGAWVERWWPTTAPGERVEIGASRDAAWASLLARMRSGTAVAIDYGHTSTDRPAHGTLTGYREGRLEAPVPDGSVDVTAHVAVDSLPHDELLTQREALTRLGVSTATPPHELARTDPTAYLHALADSSAAHALGSGPMGDFHWAVSRV